MGDSCLAGNGRRQLKIAVADGRRAACQLLVGDGAETATRCRPARDSTLISLLATVLGDPMFRTTTWNAFASPVVSSSEEALPLGSSTGLDADVFARHVHDLLRGPPEELRAALCLGGHRLHADGIILGQINRYLSPRTGCRVSSTTSTSSV